MTQHEGARAHALPQSLAQAILHTELGHVKRPDSDCNISYLESAGGGGRVAGGHRRASGRVFAMR